MPEVEADHRHAGHVERHPRRVLEHLADEPVEIPAVLAVDGRGIPRAVLHRRDVDRDEHEHDASRSRSSCVDATDFRLRPPAPRFTWYATGRASRSDHQFVTAWSTWITKMASRPSSSGMTKGFEMRACEYTLNFAGPKYRSRFPARCTHRKPTRLNPVRAIEDFRRDRRQQPLPARCHVDLQPGHSRAGRKDWGDAMKASLVPIAIVCAAARATQHETAARLDAAASAR